MRGWLVVAIMVSLPSVMAAADVDAARVDAVLAAWARPDTPGCAVAVVQGGKVAHAKGYGMADLERGVPIAADTVFDIGSISKQFTAAAIHLLAADKRLALDDDLRKHVPEIPQLGRGVITIRHLLHHTGGLRDYEALLRLAGWRFEDVTTVPQTLAALGRQKGVAFEPGAKFEYSNTGYFVLAQIAERASGRTLAALLRDRVFQPLAMARTSIFDDHTRIYPHRAIGYGPRKGGGWRLNTSQWEQTGDGSVLTTVLDLAKWDANFDAPKAGGAALVEALQVRGKTADGTVLDYASGLVHGTYRGAKTVSHSGGWAGYRADFVRFPAHHTSIIVLCNASSANPVQLSRGIADVVLADQLAPAPARPAPALAAQKVSAAVLDAWAGTYRRANGDVFIVVRRGDQLTVDAGGDTLELVPTGERTVSIAGRSVVLERSGAAPARTVAVRGDAKDVYTELTPYKPTAAELAAVAGRYACPELATDWALAVSAGALTISGRGIDDGTVLFLSSDSLTALGLGVTLRVIRGPRGVAALTLAGELPVRCDRAP